MLLCAFGLIVLEAGRDLATKRALVNGAALEPGRQALKVMGVATAHLDAPRLRVDRLKTDRTVVVCVCFRHDTLVVICVGAGAYSIFLVGLFLGCCLANILMLFDGCALV